MSGAARAREAKLAAARGLWMPPRGDGADPRLPPGQHATRGRPVLDLGVRPEIDPASWRLAVGGAVLNPLSLSLGGLSGLGLRDAVSDVHCVTGWSRLGNGWRGVPASAVLALARPLPEATHAVLAGADGYAASLPLEFLLADGAMLATHWDGELLTLEHGAPVRAVVPSLYFWKSAKWLVGVEVTVGERPGFWERSGYHGRGDPWAEERYRGSELPREVAPGTASALRRRMSRPAAAPAGTDGFFDGEF